MTTCRLPEVALDAVARARLPGATTADGVHAVTILLTFGLIDEAWDLATDLARRRPEGQLRMLRLCRFLRAGRSLLPLGAQKEPGVMVAHNPEASHVILVFAGQHGRFWSANDFINRKDASIVFLRDTDRYFYLDGITGLGASYAECVEALRAIIQIIGAAAMGGRRALHCIGHSTGGYAALRFGLDLGAAGVLAFDAATDLDFRDRPRPQLLELQRRSPEIAADLKWLYAKAQRPPEVVLCYGEDHRSDAAAARYIADLPGVRLKPIPHYSGHNSMFEMARSKLFYPLIDEVLATAM